MKEKDIKQIKFDLGLCADMLMSMFLSMFISELLGIIYFLLITKPFYFLYKNNFDSTHPIYYLP